MNRLYINLARIGDLVMATNTMRFLARDSNLSLLCQPYGRPLLGRESYLKQIHTLQNPHRGSNLLTESIIGRHRIKLGRILQQQQFDEIAINARVSRTIKSWVDRTFPNIPQRQLSASKDGLHYSEYARQQLIHAGFDTSTYDPIPHLSVSREANVAARELLKPLGERVVAVQLGSQKTDRSFSLQRRTISNNPKSLSSELWVQLITHILANDDADAVIITGSPREAHLALALQSRFPKKLASRIHDWTSRIPLADAAATFSACTAMISPDTGPAHIAAAVGCPLLATFGPTDHRFYGMKGTAPVALIRQAGCCPPELSANCGNVCQYSANRCLGNLDAGILLQGWNELIQKVENTSPPALSPVH